MSALTLVVILLSVISAGLLVTLLLVLRRLPSRDDLLSQQQIDESRDAARLASERQVIEKTIADLKGEVLSRQSESFLNLRTSMDSAQQLMQQQLAEGNRTLVNKVAVFGEMERKLGELAKQASSIEEVGKNIQSLSELLRPPKLRGALGELFLENLLAQILPSNLYELQYQFASGTRVDAVIKLGDRMLPIDAKFPVESFQRLLLSDDESSQKDFLKRLKSHVDTIELKYLRQGDTVTRFALIYIPSEAVYSQFVASASTDALEYALSKRVVPTSPGHLYAFLATLASMNAELSIFQRGITKDLRWLLDGLGQMEETVNKMLSHQERIDGSLRMLGGTFDKSKTELSTLRRQLDGLAGHVRPEGISSDASPNSLQIDSASVSKTVSTSDSSTPSNRLVQTSQSIPPVAQEARSLFDNIS